MSHKSMPQMSQTSRKIRQFKLEPDEIKLLTEHIKERGDVINIDIDRFNSEPIYTITILRKVWRWLKLTLNHYRDNCDLFLKLYVLIRALEMQTPTPHNTRFGDIKNIQMGDYVSKVRRDQITDWIDAQSISIDYIFEVLKPIGLINETSGEEKDEFITADIKKIA